MTRLRIAVVAAIVVAGTSAGGQEYQLEVPWTGFTDVMVSYELPSEVRLDLQTTFGRTQIGSAEQEPVKYVDRWGEKTCCLSTTDGTKPYVGRRCGTDTLPPNYPKLVASTKRKVFTRDQDERPTEEDDEEWLLRPHGECYAELEHLGDLPAEGSVESALEFSRTGLVHFREEGDEHLAQWQGDLQVVDDLDEFTEWQQMFLVSRIEHRRKDGFVSPRVPQQRLALRRELYTGFFNWTLRCWEPPQGMRVFSFSFSMLR